MMVVQYFFTPTLNASFLDYKITNDEPTLTQNTTYYYSVFYREDALNTPPTRFKDYTIRTLTYKEGMQQLLLSLMTKTKEMNSNSDVLFSSQLLELFFDFSNEWTIIDSDLVRKYGWGYC